jgi:hypothetical protein
MNQMKKKNEEELQSIRDIEIKNFEETKQRIEDKRGDHYGTAKNSVVVDEDAENQKT